MVNTDIAHDSDNCFRQYVKKYYIINIEWMEQNKNIIRFWSYL